MRELPEGKGISSFLHAGRLWSDVLVGRGGGAGRSVHCPSLVGIHERFSRSSQLVVVLVLLPHGVW